MPRSGSGARSSQSRRLFTLGGSRMVVILIPFGMMILLWRRRGLGALKLSKREMEGELHCIYEEMSWITTAHCEDWCVFMSCGETAHEFVTKRFDTMNLDSLRCSCLSSSGRLSALYWSSGQR